MQRVIPLVTAALCLMFIAAGCVDKPDRVSTSDLIRVIERDAIPFDGPTLPVGAIDRLAHHKVVVVGETQHGDEDREFVARLVRSLQPRGCRQLLIEWPHMSDWLVEDYVKDGGLEPEWIPPAAMGGDLLVAIREFNHTQPADGQVDVHGIDVNLDQYGGASEFLNMLALFTGKLPPHEIVGRFFGRQYGSPTSQRLAVESLRNDLQTYHEVLIDLWGPRAFDQVKEMAEVELVSIGVRALQADYGQASADLRENAMKRIATLKLAVTPNLTLINVGAKHIRKTHEEPDEPEWLGEYLAKNTDAVGGSVFILEVVEAAQESLAGEADNDVLRVMNEAWPGNSVFLPLDDAIFSKENVPMATVDGVYPSHLQDYFDALILLPSTNRVFVQ